MGVHFKSGQQIIAARTDAVDARTWKILRRVCMQYTTGIRKPFSILGRICRIEHDSQVVPRPGVVFLDVPAYDTNWVALDKVTPDCILAVIQTKVCHEIMES